LAEHLAAEDVLREHSLHGLLDRKLGLRLHELPVARRLEAAGNRRVPVPELLVELRARELHLRRVHDDDEVTGVDMRGERRLVLAAETRGDLARETAEGLVRRVDDPPAPDFRRL